MRKLLIIVLLISVVSSGCRKEEEEINVFPVIEYVSISHTEVVEFDNEVALTFSYVDEDGDLGYQDPDTYSLRVKDSRLENFDWYHIPPMTPEMQSLNISGEYTVYLNPLFLLGNGAQETTTVTLQLQDRAGNWSNQIVSPEILINDSL